MCTVYIYYVYINAHTYSVYFENIYTFIFTFSHFADTFIQSELQLGNT